MTITEQETEGAEPEAVSGPSAKIILDSVGPLGQRLTTMEVKMHRFVLAEFNTHRVFSRNSASSRAIPLNKQIDRVLSDPAIPLSLPKEQSGMQGGEELSEDDRDRAVQLWLRARDSAVEQAADLGRLGVHKSVVNRLLEPFMWHTVIVSATYWQNFFDQRCSPLAQPEMRAAAEAMERVHEGSTPTEVDWFGWHTPYIQPDERDLVKEDRIKVSVARCARVSYLTHDGVRDVDKDLALYDRLVSARPMHASPLEHVAAPDDQAVRGNFDRWVQYRSIVERNEGIETLR